MSRRDANASDLSSRVTSTGTSTGNEPLAVAKQVCQHFRDEGASLRV